MPNLQVVISSSWREHYQLEEMRDFFAEDLRARVIGVTPVIEPASQIKSGSRQRECQAWIAGNAPGASWLALDDDTSLYEGNSHALICDSSRGLADPAVCYQLECWLSGRSPVPGGALT